MWRLIFSLLCAVVYVQIEGAFCSVYPKPLSLERHGGKGQHHTFNAEKYTRIANTVPFYDAKGKQKQVRDFAGKIVVLHFWATWCPPCIGEMPPLNTLQKNNPDMAVIAVHIGQKTFTKVKKFYKKYTIDALDIYGANVQVLETIGVKSLPFTLIYDRKGLAKGYFLGPVHWNRAKVMATVDGG